MNPRRGYLTTEFWLALAAQVSGLVVLFTGLDVSAQADGAVRAGGGLLAALAALGYAISRGLAKRAPALPTGTTVIRP